MKTAEFLRGSARVFFISGPVGLVYALRLTYLRRKLQGVEVLMEREKSLHRSHMQALSLERIKLIKLQQSASQAAAAYWRNCDQYDGPKAGEQS